MPYITPDYAQLVQTQKQEIANLNPNLSLQDDDDEMIRAHGVAAVVEGAYQHQQWVLKQLFAQTAEKEFLEYLAAKVGITRKQAVAAQVQSKYQALKAQVYPLAQISSVTVIRG